ncbi:fused response regulator/phosphatase [Actinokineospora pegani]|uniref:fused response regulator/phosphatase n=1 Tax=Actinokineospora pegani TaxID=2654637 RepID=UPI0012E9C101|nr:fused response regulator/phosphatase [Actinokineospora pegani]
MTAGRAAEPARVLVVNDLEASRFVASSWLRRNGHDAIEAATGGEALALLASTEVDVVLLDVRLPDMDGFDVTERIKADPRTSSVPVILISAAYVEPGDKIAGLTRGADAYLTEPVEPGELIANVEAALRYHRARALAEHLADQLTELTTATLAINAAPTFDELVAAAATGAAAVLDCAATAVVVTPAGAVRAADCRDGQAVLRTDTSGLLDRATTSVRGAHGDGRIATVDQDPPVVVALARAKPGKPPICIAVDPAAASGPDDRNLLLQLAQATALAANALRTITEEHNLALTLQRSLLPAALPDRPDLPMTARYVPAAVNAEIGGDFYEVAELDDKVLVAIGDVCGHSVQAATIMGAARHALRAYALEGHSPAMILRRLDVMLQRFHPIEGMTTMCVVLIDPRAGTMAVANAGHIPPLVVDEHGGRYLDVWGPLLGLGMPRPEATEFPLPPGTTVLLTTDGLVERSNVDLDEGMANLKAAVAHTDDLDELCDRVLAKYGQGQQDDIALLVLRRT